MLKRIVVITCVACLATLTACTPVATQSTDDTAAPLADSVVTTLSPRDGVRYFDSGIHAATETSVAIGVLRYRADSDTEGAWLLISRDVTPAVLAADVEPFANLIGEPGFDSEMWPLDGQYVAAEGSILATEDKNTDFEVSGLSLVADIFPTETNVYSEPGLYDMPDGKKLVLGWVGGTEDGITTLLDRSPDANGEAKVVAIIPKAGKGPPTGEFFDATCIVVKTDPIPVLELPWGSGGSPEQPIEMHIGMPSDWQQIERTGVKDLPDGRHRVVGLLVGGGQGRDDPSDLSIWVAEPWPRTLLAARWVVALDDPDGHVVIEDETMLDWSYVAVEGVLSANSQHLLVRSFEAIPTP